MVISENIFWLQRFFYCCEQLYVAIPFFGKAIPDSSGGILKKWKGIAGSSGDILKKWKAIAGSSGGILKKWKAHGSAQAPA